MAGGKWDASALPTRAGLYINFVNKAIAQVTNGARGVVAIPLMKYAGTAEAKKVYTVTNEKEAITLFGDSNINSLKFILSGGAKEILVYTMPNSPQDADYVDMRLAFDAYLFNIFVYDGIVTAAEQDKCLAWLKANKEEGKDFQVVFGCTDAAEDAKPATGDARSVRLSDEYAINLINGVVINGKAYNSAEYAPYIAGLVAGTPINKAITFVKVSANDVTKRLTGAEIKASLAKGSLVLVHDGEKVKVERGIATDKSKIRKVRAKIAIATDLNKTAADSFIGQVDNNKAGQQALMNAIKAYLENLANANVLVMDSINVQLDSNYRSVGDQVYLAISYMDVDSMEQIFLTVNVGGAE